ncbi:NHP2-like protein 1 [Orobanche hederae]
MLTESPLPAAVGKSILASDPEMQKNMISAMVKSAIVEGVKWAVDESGVHEITKSLCMGESELLILRQGHEEDAMLRHLHLLAGFNHVPCLVSDKHCGEPIIVCTIIRRPVPVEESDSVALPTGKLNPEPYPLAVEMCTASLMGLIKEAVGENMLRWGVHGVTNVLGTSSSEVELVIIAADADPYDILLHLPPLTKFKGVPCVFVPSQQDIGTNARLPHPVPVCCVTKKEGPQLNCFLRTFRATYPTYSQLPYWNGKPKPKIDLPTPSVTTKTILVNLNLIAATAMAMKEDESGSDNDDDDDEDDESGSDDEEVKD